MNLIVIAGRCGSSAAKSMKNAAKGVSSAAKSTKNAAKHRSSAAKAQKTDNNNKNQKKSRFLKTIGSGPAFT